MAVVIDRNGHRHRCQELFSTVPCVALLGARQVGKTTLAQEIAESWSGPVHRFDLELPSDLAGSAEREPESAELDGLGVFDEAQRPPGLFAVLRSLTDASLRWRLDPVRTFGGREPPSRQAVVTGERPGFA